MIAFLRGSIIEKSEGSAVLEAGGVGYEVRLANATLSRLPGPGQPAELFISESTALYGGQTTLYGFLTREEREVFASLRDHVPSTGAKKALEYLDKALRSLPDFRHAILADDQLKLAQTFGFTKKTSGRLVAALKDKLGGDAGRLEPRDGQAAEDGAMSQAMDALASLGYRPAEARAALQSVSADLAGGRATVEDLLRLALKRL